MNHHKLQSLLDELEKPIKGHVEDTRHFAAQDVPHFYRLLDGRLKEFFLLHPSESQFPAIDIGSGWGSHVVNMALHFRPPLFEKELVWYASDWAGKKGLGGPVENETRAALRYSLQESKEKVENLLFTDKNGEPIHVGDGVELVGLKSVQFNGRRGRARGLDSNAEGRIAVQLSPHPMDQKSFRQENLLYAGETSMEDTILRMMRRDGSHEEFFQGLLDRTREIDILRQETWSNVQDLEGQCALVTCTSLLTCLGYRDPTAWQDTMEFASKFLCKDGFLLQYDAVGYADFGNTQAMEAFVEEKSLGLKLEDSVHESYRREDGQVLSAFVWRKV